jgi:hypothetical protein
VAAPHPLTTGSQIIVGKMGIRDFDREAAIQAYIRHAELGTQDQEYFWGWDAVNDFVHTAPAEDAWDLVVTLTRRAPDEILGNVAAGPLEDVVRLHGAALVDWIEGEARRDERFRWALGCVWLSRGVLPREVEDRIVRASEGHLLVLGDEEGDGSPAGA